MGGSCSRCCPAVVISTRVSFDPILISPTRSHSAKSTRIVENCLVVWLFDDPSRRFEDDREQLRRRFYGFQVFTDSDACIDYLRELEDERAFLITSAIYQSILSFYHLPHLEKIYVFDPLSFDGQKRKIYSNVFLDLTDLSKQLQQDIDLCEYDLAYFSTIPSSVDVSTKEHIAFVFIQIFNEIMARLKFDSIAKNVFVDFCRLHYANTDEQLDVIDEFAQHYRPHTALDWLKRSCFISKVLNRVKRTREIDALYKLGFFTKHLTMQLAHLHDENGFLMKTLPALYRGKTLSSDDFDLLINNHCHGLLSFANFLSTTVNRDNAIDFVRRRLAAYHDRVAVLFEIRLDRSTCSGEWPYALLRSSDAKNGEVYFDAGTVFRIESIEQTTEDSLILWCVRLQLISNDDPQLLHVLTPLRTPEQHENPLSCLGKLLMEMGEYRRVEQFFLEILNDTSVLSQPRRLVRAHHGLGANYAHKNDFGTALVHYEQALKTSLSYLPGNHVNLIPLYKNIGDCCLKQGNHHPALDNYERAMHLIASNQPCPKSYLADELQTLINETKASLDNSKGSTL